MVVQVVQVLPVELELVQEPALPVVPVVEEALWARPASAGSPD